MTKECKLGTSEYMTPAAASRRYSKAGKHSGLYEWWVTDQKPRVA